MMYLILVARYFMSYTYNLEVLRSPRLIHFKGVGIQVTRTYGL